MIFRKVIAVGLFCAGLFCLAQAQVPMTGAGKGAPGGAAYTGPGNVIAFTAWYGLRGYNTAFSGSIANICDASTGLVCADATWAGFTLTIPTISGLVCGVGISCAVKTLYDQSGGGNNATQATNANRPALTLNAVGTRPCMTFSNAAATQLNTSAFATISQPWSMSVVAERTGTFTSFEGIFANNLGLIWNNTVNTLGVYGGSVGTASAADSAPHGVQGVFNGASSIASVDGTPTTVNAGSSNVGPVALFIGASAAGGGNMDGIICEAGILNGTAFTPTNNTNLYNNQHSYYTVF